METLAKVVGAIVLAMYLLSWLGYADFVLCIGKPGACTTEKKGLTA